MAGVTRKGCLIGTAFAVAGLVPSALDAQTIRDSAGIQLVESARPSWTAAQALRLSKSPTLVIGTQNGEPYELSRVKGAVRVSGGRVVVADGGSNQLRYYDATGKYIKSVGRQGAGPGEFRELERLDVLPGDTLVAMERNGPRVVSLLSGDGLFLKRLDIGSVASPSVAGATVIESRRLAATLSGGRRVVVEHTNPAPRRVGTRWVHPAFVSIVDKNNAVVQSLGAMPAVQYAMLKRPQPTWLAPLRVFASAGSSFYTGFGDEYSIRVYNADGKLTRIIRRKWTDIPITKSDINTFVVEWSKRWANTPGPAGDKERQEIRDEPYATKVPAFTALLADQVGRLWVREAHLADAPRAGNMQTSPLVPTVWSLFSSAGVWQGDVTMPAFFLPTDIGRDYVLGIARDADGVETVVMYALGVSS